MGGEGREATAWARLPLVVKGLIVFALILILLFIGGPPL